MAAQPSKSGIKKLELRIKKSLARANKYSKSSGFTLIELVVVIAIIGALSTGLYSAVTSPKVKQRAQDAVRLRDINQIKTAVELYYQDHNCYPAASDNAFANSLTNTGTKAWVEGSTKYMSIVPLDPTDNPYIYKTDSSSCPQYMTLFAKLSQPAANFTACNIPSYTKTNATCIPSTATAPLDTTWGCVSSGSIACGAGPTPTPFICSGDSDCTGGKVCVNGSCVQPGAPPPTSNSSVFISQGSPPALMNLGATANISFTYKNNGATTWSPAGIYELGSQNPQDNTTWGNSRVPMTAGSSIIPGKSYTFYATITAPLVGGIYNYQWQMLQSKITIPSTGLVSYWKMDETTGTAVADSKGTSTGTATGTTIVPGIFNNARSFNGTSDYISTNYSSNFDVAPSGLSVGMWIKPTTTLQAGLPGGDPYKVFASSYDCSVNKGWNVAYDGTSGQLYVALGNGTTGAAIVRSTVQTLSAGSWYHVVFIAYPNSTSSKIYLNGVDVTGTTSSFGYSPPTGSMTIGRQTTNTCTSNYRYVNATLDDIQIYNRALIQTEISGLYTSTPFGDKTTNTTVLVVPNDLVVDADQDGYYTSSPAPAAYPVIAAQVVNGRTYYKTATSGYQYVSASATTTLGGSDCNDGSANIFQNVANIATDADLDGYYTGAPSTQCVGATYATEVSSGQVGHWAMNENSGSSVADSSSGNNNSGNTWGAPISGLLAWWKMDEGANNNAFDSSGNNNTATFTNTSWTGGKLSSAESFNGSNANGSSGSIAGIAGDHAWTISTWVNTTANPNFAWGTLLEVGNATCDKNPVLLRNPSQQYIVGFRNGTQISTTGLSIGTWGHLTAVYTGSLGTLSLYFNGQLVAGPTPVAAAGNGDGGKVNFGNDACGMGHYFNGKLDDVHIYNRALTSTEVGNLYSNAGAGGPTRSISGIGLNGSGQYVQIDNPSSGSLNPSSATITGWFQASNLAKPSGWQTIFFKGNYDCTTGCEDRQYALFLNNNGSLTFSSTSVNNIGSTQSACSTAAGLISPGKWYHVAAGINSAASNMYIYVNGFLAGGGCPYNTSGIRTTTGPFLIGANTTWDSSLGLNGSVDEFRIYNRSISASEISQTHQYGNYYMDASGNYTQILASKASGGSDCNDASPGNYISLTGYADADGDGHSVNTPTVFCGGPNLPAGYLTTPGGDCNDFNANVFQNLASGVTDSDHDGYYAGGAASPDCVGDAVAAWVGSGQVGFWNMDYNGSEPDFSQTYGHTYIANTGSLQGYALQGTGPYGDQPTYFNGTNGYMSVPDSQDMRLGTYTVSVWLYMPVQNEYFKGVVGKPGRNYNMWVGNANNADGTGAAFVHHRFYDTVNGGNDGCPNTGYVVQFNTWNHIVITNDGVTCKTYVMVSGPSYLPVVSGSVAGSLVTTTGPTYFATNLDSGPVGNFLNGYLDDVQIWNRALTGGEIYNLRYNNLPYYAYYKDVSGNYSQLSSTDALGGGDPNDANVAVWKTAATYYDNDHDSFGQNTSAGNQWVGSTATVGYSLDNTDCNDGNVSLFRYLTGYQDSDNDGYTTGGAQNICSGNSLPAGWRAAPNGNDCNDGTAALYQWLTGYQDSDMDGYTTGGAQNICSGATLPSGWRAAPTANDCADNYAFIYQLVSGVFWYDYDHDLYTTGGSGTICVGPAAIINTRWGQAWYYMDYLGQYSIPTVSAGTDCNDGNASYYQWLLSYQDSDADGYGNPYTGQWLCSDSTYFPGWVSNAQDCYDANWYAKPASPYWFSSPRQDGSYDWNCDGGYSYYYYDYYLAYYTVNIYSDGYSCSSGQGLACYSTYYPACGAYVNNANGAGGCAGYAQYQWCGGGCSGSNYYCSCLYSCGTYPATQLCQ